MLDFSRRIFVGLTTTSLRRKEDHWKTQLQEINQLQLKEITLFPEFLPFKKRKELYQALEKSCVRKIRLVHLRGEDFTQEEFIYFFKKYHTRFFNCHEKHFDSFYQKFPQFRKNILLELDYNNQIENRILPNRAAGFCLDFAHFQTSQERGQVEYPYVLQHLKDTKFPANHLNGYSRKRKKDLHFVTHQNQFDYLKALPKEIFGEIIGLELENSIHTQLRFKKYLVRMLNKKFNQ